MFGLARTVSTDGPPTPKARSIFLKTTGSFLLEQRGGDCQRGGHGGQRMRRPTGTGSVSSSNSPITSSSRSSRATKPTVAAPSRDQRELGPVGPHRGHRVGHRDRRRPARTAGPSARPRWPAGRRWWRGPRRGRARCRRTSPSGADHGQPGPAAARDAARCPAAAASRRTVTSWPAGIITSRDRGLLQREHAGQQLASARPPIRPCSRSAPAGCAAPAGPCAWASWSCGVHAERPQHRVGQPVERHQRRAGPPGRRPGTAAPAAAPSAPGG